MQLCRKHATRASMASESLDLGLRDQCAQVAARLMLSVPRCGEFGRDLRPQGDTGNCFRVPLHSYNAITVRICEIALNLNLFWPLSSLGWLGW